MWRITLLINTVSLASVGSGPITLLTNHPGQTDLVDFTQDLSLRSQHPFDSPSLRSCRHERVVETIVPRCNRGLGLLPLRWSCHASKASPAPPHHAFIDSHKSIFGLQSWRLGSSQKCALDMPKNLTFSYRLSFKTHAQTASTTDSVLQEAAYLRKARHPSLLELCNVTQPTPNCEHFVLLLPTTVDTLLAGVETRSVERENAGTWAILQMCRCAGVHRCRFASCASFASAQACLFATVHVCVRAGMEMGELDMSQRCMNCAIHTHHFLYFSNMRVALDMLKTCIQLAVASIVHSACNTYSMVLLRRNFAYFTNHTISRPKAV